MANRVAAKPESQGATAAPATALYLYAVSRVPAVSISLPGVDGKASVEAIVEGEYASYVSRVDRGEYADRLSENMERLEWLADAGVRHQRVVGELASRTSVVPARFGAVFLTDENVRADLRERAAALRRVFQRIEGADEWGVKLYRLAQPVAIPMAPTSASGREYLQRKAKSMDAVRERRPDPELEEFVAALQKVSRASAPTGRVSAGQRDLEWQATFLVARDSRKQWETVLAGFAARWNGLRRIESTGPWPPYSFVAEPAEGTR